MFMSNKGSHEAVSLILLTPTLLSGENSIIVVIVEIVLIVIRVFIVIVVILVLI